MENKINIAELLKDCPKGMELDCVSYSDVKFMGIDTENDTIILQVGNKFIRRLNKYGQDDNINCAKCVIFPKGKTTWEGFVPPCKFKDGDIISDSLGSCIFKGEGMIKGTVDYYCGTHAQYFHIKDSKQNHNAHYGDIVDYRLATEEEKQKLFQAIKDNGYKWNAETKTLEKLIKPKFKVGDSIKKKGDYISGIITDISDGMYKVEYKSSGVAYVNIKFQDYWELVPNKFDITTLVPFESRVLVRNSNSGFWQPTFWGIYEAGKANEHQYRNYLTTKGFFRHCIPYNDDTKHLLGTTDDCEECYKTWE